MLVVDSSLVVAALTDVSATGAWAERALVGQPLAAPHLMTVEAASVLRRAAASGHLSDDVASLAYDELVSLPVEHFPFPPLAGRVWELRRTVTSYDAWYVALAEALSAELATLDARLSRASGPRCSFLLPPEL